MPKISVIIALYNGSKYIADTIESCLWQTEKNWELIIVDDGSTDDSCNIVSKYQKKDSRIQLVRSINQGPHVSRNIGLSKASSKYIKILDHDDLLAPWALQHQLKTARSEKAGVVIGSIERFSDGDEKKIIEKIRSLSPNDRSVIITPKNMIRADANYLATCNEMLFEKEVLTNAGGFCRYLETGEEFNLAVRIYLKSPDTKIVYLENPPVLWKRVMDDSLGSQLRSIKRTGKNWGLLTREQIAREIVDSEITIDDELRRYLFDSLYVGATYAYRDEQKGHAITAYEVWKRADQPMPTLTPEYHDSLHRLFGFENAEKILKSVRKVLHPFKKTTKKK